MPNSMLNDDVASVVFKYYNTTPVHYINFKKLFPKAHVGDMSDNTYSLQLCYEYLISINAHVNQASSMHITDKDEYNKDPFAQLFIKVFYIITEISKNEYFENYDSHLCSEINQEINFIYNDELYFPKFKYDIDINTLCIPYEKVKLEYHVHDEMMYMCSIMKNTTYKKTGWGYKMIYELKNHWNLIHKFENGSNKYLEYENKNIKLKDIYKMMKYSITILSTNDTRMNTKPSLSMSINTFERTKYYLRVYVDAKVKRDPNARWN